MPTISRRELLQAAAAAAVLGVAGCRRGKDVAHVLISSPFDEIRILRDSLRRSPDHLAVIARDLVAKRDAAALHLFIRDQIRTLPDDESGFSSPVKAMRWGTRATIRCGAGTPREKAELLAELYRAAGFTAEVVSGRILLADGDSSLLLRGHVAPSFAPSLTKGERAALEAASIGRPPIARAAQPLDPDDRVASALAAQLAVSAGSFLGSGVQPASRRSIELPLVRVRTAAGEQLANPNLPGSAFNAPQLIGKPSLAGSASPTPSVRLAILMSRASAPTERLELVSAEWTASELAGRQAIVGFPPPVPASELLTMRISSVRSVMPMLALRGGDLRAADYAAQTRSGRAITLSGDLIDIGADGAVRVNDEPVSDSGGDATLITRVASLEARARVAAFPSVHLAVTARDAAGAVVEGLPASAFTVQDDVPVLASLVRNRRMPRVLLLLDGSRSLPESFLDSGAVQFARLIAERLLADDPTLRLRVRAVGETPAIEPWLSDAADVEQSAQKHLPKSFESGLWRSLAEAHTAADPTVVVLVTDGRATDTPRTDYVSRIAAGPPAVVIAVGNVDTKTTAALAELSGGEATRAADPEAAVRSIQRLVAIRTAAAHQLRYAAPIDATGVRTVRVALVGRDIAATANYTVPAPAARVKPESISGLYVSVQVGRETFERPLVEGPADEVEAAFFGTAVLTFEGGAPTASAWIDDVLTGMLAQEPLLRAIAKKDRKAAAAELTKAPYGVSPDIFSYFPQLNRASDDAVITFADGISAVLTTSRRRPGRAGLRRVDVLPLMRVATAGGPPEGQPLRTLTRSARLALIETTGFSTSTRSLLEGKSLIVVPPGREVGSVLKDADGARVGMLAGVADTPLWRARVRLVAADASTAAFWAISPRNGTLIGVLPDGSGGGEVEEINAVFDRAKTILDNVGVAAAVLGAGFGFGVWLSFEGTKLQKLRDATLTIATLEVQPGDISSLGDLPCSIATGALGPIVGRLGTVGKLASEALDWIGRADAMAGAWAGGGICSKL